MESGWLAKAKGVWNKIVGGQQQPAEQQPTEVTAKAEVVSAEDAKFVNEIFEKVTKMMRTSSKLTQ